LQLNHSADFEKLAEKPYFNKATRILRRESWLLQLLQLRSPHQLQQSNSKVGNFKSTLTTPNRSRPRATSGAKGVVAIVAVVAAALPTACCNNYRIQA
jgi:hypothetical protein